MGMTLDQIDAFLAVIKYGNFAGAASSLYLTQSALGHRISNLEKELGLELFMRARGVRRVELTSEGDQFVPIAKEMKDLWLRALALSGTDVAKNVRISLIFSMQTFLMADMLTKLRKAGFKPYVVSSNTAHAIKSLRDGDLDFAIAGGMRVPDDEAFMSELLGKERLVFVSGRESRYGESVRIADLDPANEVYSPWSTSNESWHIKLFGDRFMPLVSIENALQVIPVLESNPDTWTLLPSGFAHSYLGAGSLKFSELDEKPPAREVYLLARRPIKTECYEILSQSLRERLTSREGFTLSQ